MTTKETTMNLTAINRGHGSIKIHKHGCRDIKRDARGASVWDIDAESLKDVVIDCYPPDEFDYDADTEWESFAGDIVIVNCVGHLTTETVKVTARRSHANCSHEVTPKARAACRKAGGPAQITDHGNGVFSIDTDTD